MTHRKRLAHGIQVCGLWLTAGMFLLLWHGCTTPPSYYEDQKKYAEDDPRYRNAYPVRLDDDEKPLRFGYHYIVTRIPDGYRVRVFHPDKKILTEDKTYGTPNLTMLHGPCKRFWDDGSIREQGSYLYGRKQGLWVESEPGRGKSASGLYLNERKEGEWTQLDSNGLVEAIYTWHDDQRHGKFYLFDEAGTKINEGLYRADTLIAELFKQPKTQKPYLKSCELPGSGNVYTCTEATILQSIFLNLKYPSKAKAMKIEGAALVQWDVLADGSVANFRVPQGLCNEIEEECRRVFKSMPQWVPGQKDGLPVSSTISVPINFRL